ncbi:major facilitator superfamily domain-containing protein 8-like [Haliotis rufescens]|uniref:major facilitator superfamily domain-containing protein 8-like n=1 Tax=Haliotis rufescens TaxID=6454 RepID=UPI00201E88E7|nr:major facilitator superfamily domain-containing protein 8-like [Haliotis rufescens]
MVSLKAKKRLTYFTIGTYFFMGGVEYAVILPSAWLYLHNRFSAEEYFLGLMLSAFSFSGMFAGPLMGRWADKSRRVRVILLFAALFEIGGSFMYFIGMSKWFLVASRLVAGVGVGGEAVILAEIARFTTEQERTSVISILIAVRQCGLLLGPGFNFFLSLVDFYIGPFPVDRFSSPGLLMAFMWVIMELLLLLLFSEPGVIFRQMRVMNQVETAYTPLSDEEEEQYTEIPPQTVTYDDVYPDLTCNTPASAIPTAIQSTECVPNGGTSTATPNMYGSIGNASISDISVASYGSVGDESLGTVSIGNSSELIESAERLMQSDSSGVSEKGKVTSRQNSRSRKLKALLDSKEHSVLPRIESVSDVKDPFTEGRLKFLYDEYIREEIVVLLGLQFITIFAQVTLETMLTPLTDKLLHWNELQNSFLYCGAGVEIILIFVLTSWLSRKIEDRYLIAIGGFILTSANVWYLYFLPSCTPDNPGWTLPGFIAGTILDVAGLPFLLVCGVSLYSKLTRKETQGLSQGIRRSVTGIGTIMAPLWAGSTISMLYLNVGVLVAILFISQVMLWLSFKRLKPPQSAPSPPPASNPGDIATERQPLIG